MGRVRDRKSGAHKQPSSVLSQNTITTPSSSQAVQDSLRNHLVAFSSSNDKDKDARGRTFYATVTQAADLDTVRVYDTASGQCTARWASNTASDRITSIEWLHLPEGGALQNADSSVPRGKKRRKSQTQGADEGTSRASAVTKQSTGTAPYLAVGLSSGSTAILHPTTSSVIATLASPTSSTSAVRALAFLSQPLLSTPADESSATSHTPLLWISHASGKVAAWDVNANQSGPVNAFDLPLADCTAIAVRHDDAHSHGEPTYQVLAASHSISAYRVSWTNSSPKGSKVSSTATVTGIGSFTGHTSAVTKLQWISSGQNDAPASMPDFFSVAAKDRYINLWAMPVSSDVDSSMLREGRLSATATLDEDVLQTDFSSSAGILCVVSRGGSISLFDLQNLGVLPAVSDNKKRRKSSIAALAPATVITSPSRSGVASAAIVPGRDILAVSEGPRPSFEKAPYRDADGVFISIVQLKKPFGSSNSIADTSADNQKTSQRAVYTEPSQSAVVSAHASTIDSSTGSSSRTRPAATEPTLAHRLQVLNMNMKAKAEAKRKADAEAKAQGQDEDQPSTGVKRIADATSLSQSLVQALHSSDTRLLESCLSHTNPTTIRATVKRLPTTLVIPFVDAIVQRISKSKSGFGAGTGAVGAHRGKELMEWLRCVMVVHLSYLVTVPGLTAKFASLYATLENRLLVHNQLLALNGRLDLVISQMDLQSDPAVKAVQHLPIQKKPEPVKRVRLPKPIKTESSAKYREGQSESESSSSEDEAVDDASAGGPSGIEAAEEDGEVEDLMLESGAEEEGVSDGSDSEEEEVTSSRHSAPRVAMNGFLDLEAEESDEETSDDGYGPNRGASVNGIGRFPVKSLLNGKSDKSGPGADSEDEDDEENEDLDKYESDFINDASGSEGEEEESDED